MVFFWRFHDVVFQWFRRYISEIQIIVVKRTKMSLSNVHFIIFLSFSHRTLHGTNSRTVFIGIEILLDGRSSPGAFR